MRSPKERLFRRRKLLKGNARFPVELANGALEHHAEVFSDEVRVRARQLQGVFNAHQIEPPADAPANAPYLLYGLVYQQRRGTLRIIRR